VSKAVWKFSVGDYLLELQNFGTLPIQIYRGADKSLARPNGENISFDASLVIYINSTNISPIMIINRIHGNQNLLSL